jgi:hypothetical protein
MPASEVMGKFRSGKLHSGSKTGRVVKNPKQAKAILLSEARAEGHSIPKKGESKKARRKRSGKR